MQTNRRYRLQVIIHDGDQNKVGGDIGEGCAIATFDEQCFFTPTPTPTNTPTVAGPTDTPTITPTETPTPPQQPTPTPGGADLSISKSDSGAVHFANCTAAADASIIYRLDMTNGGPDTATSVTVADALPTGTTFVSCTFVSPDHISSTDCSSFGSVPAVGTNGTVTVNLGNIPFGASGNTARVTITVNANSDDIALTSDPFHINNTASVSSTASDPDTSNNSSTKVTAVTWDCFPGLRYRPNKK